MRTRDAIRMAKRDGAAVGRNAADWVFDGNSTDAQYARMLAGIRDGDPEVLDSVRLPDLSGEYADDPTPQTLANDYGIDAEARSDALDDVCSAWESAVSDAFWARLERVCADHLETAKA